MIRLTAALLTWTAGQPKSKGGHYASLATEPRTNAGAPGNSVIKRVLIVSPLLLAACSVPNPKTPAANLGQTEHLLAGPAPYKFDCHTHAGYFQFANIRVPSGPFRVTGLLQFIRERYDMSWLPIARVDLEDSGAANTQSGLEILVRQSNPELFRIAFGREPRQSLLGTMGITNLPIPFSLIFDGSGTLTGTLGRAVAPPLPHVSGLKSLMLFCSTGHVVFSDVTVAPAP